MNNLKMTQHSANVIEMEIQIEWYGLGKDVAMRYAERVVKCATLGEEFSATSAVPKPDEHIVLVRLSRSRSRS